MKNVETDREQIIKGLTSAFKNLVTNGEVSRGSVVGGWTTLMELTGLDTDFYNPPVRSSFVHHPGILGVWNGLVLDRSITNLDVNSAHYLLQNKVRSWILGQIDESDREKAERFLDAMNSVGWRKGDLDEKFPQESSVEGV